MRQNRLEKLTKYVPVLATDKDRNIGRFSQLYNADPVSVDPELAGASIVAEPIDPDPSVAARFKTDRVMTAYQEHDDRKIAVFSADVVFENGKRHHKPERMDLSNDEVLEETLEWYCSDSFVVRWLVSFAFENSDGQKRVAVLEVDGHYHQPLTEDEVRETFDSRINARVPLVEKGKDGKADFYLANSWRDDQVPISAELAEQLVVDRVMPIAMMESFLQDETTEIEGWNFVVVNLLLSSERWLDKAKGGLRRIKKSIRKVFRP